MLLYIAANGAETALAYDAPTLGPPYARPETIVASPPPLLFWRRNLIWRRGHGIWRGQYDPFHALTSLESYSGPEPDGMADPIARRVLLTDPRLVRMRRWSILPMATVERHRCFVRLIYQDARFGGRPGAGRLGQQVATPTGAPGC